MAKINLLPRANDAASAALITAQTATTRVKEIVTSGVSQGLGDDEISKRLNTAIAAECKLVENATLREQMRQSLVTAAKKWHYQLKQTYRILDRNLAQSLKQPLDININDLLRLTPYQKQIEFTKILDDGRSLGVPTVQNYQRSVKLVLKAISADPPKIVETKNGRVYVMPLRNRAEMAVRYDAHVTQVTELQQRGVEYAWTTSHPNCSPRCKDFQGKLWSLANKSGTINGISYQPIDIALKGKNDDGNGIISGYNCRHRLVEYFEGSKSPAEYSEREIKQAYAIDKQQRSYENRIRQMKTEERELRAAGFIKDASALRKKWQKTTQDYKIYSLENDRAYYPYRYIIDRAETDLHNT